MTSYGGGGGGGLGNIILLAVGAAIIYGLVTSFLDNRADSGSAAPDDGYAGVCSQPAAARLQCSACTVDLWWLVHACLGS